MRLEIGKDKNAKRYIPIDLETGLIIKGCTMADDEVGEYMVYLRDFKGNYFCDEGRNYLAKKLVTNAKIKLVPIDQVEGGKWIYYDFFKQTEKKENVIMMIGDKEITGVGSFKFTTGHINFCTEVSLDEYFTNDELSLILKFLVDMKRSGMNDGWSTWALKVTRKDLQFIFRSDYIYENKKEIYYEVRNLKNKDKDKTLWRKEF